MEVIIQVCYIFFSNYTRCFFYSFLNLLSNTYFLTHIITTTRRSSTTTSISAPSHPSSLLPRSSTPR